MAEIITSRANPKIKFIRGLRQRKARQEAGLFLVEGIRHVGEAVEAAQAKSGGASIESIWYAPDLLTSTFAQSLVDEQSRQGTPCFPVSADVFESLADKENPQGILAVARQPDLSLSSLSPHNFPWAVALVAPQDPGNLGTIMRTVDAVGASGLLLLDSSVDAYHPSAVRASMGTLFWYPLVCAAFSDFAAWAQANRYHIYGTSAHGSVDYLTVEAYAQPAILLMGSEREGLTAEQAAVCELLISLPMRGRATSLNLAVATGVMLYEMLGKLQP